MKIDTETLKNSIPVGKENSIHMKDLADKFGIETQTLKAYIRKAQEKGLPILSSSEGYWISNNRSETMIYKQKLKARNKRSSIRLNLMHNTLEEYEGEIKHESAK